MGVSDEKEYAATPLFIFTYFPYPFSLHPHSPPPGFVGERMAISTMLMSFAALSIITIEWSLLTYSLAFGKHHNPDVDPYIGGTVFGAFDSPNALRAGTTIPEHAFMVFQLAFAAVTSAVISGGVCGRITYPAWCLFIAIWHILVYVPLAHWIWTPTGWLAKRGVLDFAVSSGNPFARAP
jgi:Amt family ammonium transporter